MKAPRFLIAEDDPLHAGLLRRLVEPFGEVVLCGTAREADACLQGRSPLCALILDIGLPDGSGLDVLARARASRHTPLATVPALLQTGRLDAQLINRAYDLDAGYVVKPFAIERVERFVRSAAGAPPAFAQRIETVVDGWIAAYDLSKTEGDILLRAARGDARDAISAARAISPLTLKKHINNILKRTRDPSLQDAVERLLRAAAQDSPRVSRAGW